MDKPIYQREKIARIFKKLTCCGTCKSFIGSRAFHRHVKNCQLNHCSESINLPVALLEASIVNVDEDFRTHILAKIRDDTVGRLCVRDKVILQVGGVFYR